VRKRNPIFKDGMTFLKIHQVYKGMLLDSGLWNSEPKLYEPFGYGHVACRCGVCVCHAPWEQLAASSRSCKRFPWRFLVPTSVIVESRWKMASLDICPLPLWRRHYLNIVWTSCSAKNKVLIVPTTKPFWRGSLQ